MWDSLPKVSGKQSRQLPGWTYRNVCLQSAIGGIMAHPGSGDMRDQRNKSHPFATSFFISGSGIVISP